MKNHRLLTKIRKYMASDNVKDETLDSNFIFSNDFLAFLLIIIVLNFFVRSFLKFK